MYDNYAATWPRMLISGAILTIFTLFLAFLCYDMHATMQFSSVKRDFLRSHTIVGSLFPSVVVDRVVHEAVAYKEKTDKDEIPVDRAAKILAKKNKFLADCKVPHETSDAITAKPIYNSFANTTICFVDVAGFTSWCSERDPEQVFNLLETMCQAFDQIANRLGVFKIETIGDCYVAATGVPEYQRDHALLMVRFVYEAMVSFIRLAKNLEKSLGPGTANLCIRAGIRKYFSAS